MLGNIGDPLVKCMRQVTKGHLYHLLGVSDYYVMYRQWTQSVLCFERRIDGFGPYGRPRTDPEVLLGFTI